MWLTLMILFLLFELIGDHILRLDFLFENGNNDERRLLCETIFKRLNVSDGNIVGFDLNSPFALIASRAEGSESFLSGQPLGKRTQINEQDQGRHYQCYWLRRH